MAVRLSSFLHGRILAQKRAAIALVVGLAAPVLIAATGLVVDAGYWYQAQSSLQSAADAGVLAAARADQRLAQTTAPAKVLLATPIAKSGVDSATSSQFNFAGAGTSATLTLSATCPNAGCSASAGTTIYKVTTSIIRSDFFTRVSGLGIVPLADGRQSASATANAIYSTSTSGGSCLEALGTSQQSVVGANGNGSIVAANCQITANSNYGLVNGSCTGSSGGAITTNGSGSVIEGQNVETAGCVSAGTGTIAAGSNGNYLASNVQTAGQVQSDPLAGMGNPPTYWETATGIPACNDTTVGTGNSYTLTISPPVGSLSCNVGSPTKPSQGTVIFSGGSYFFPPTGFSQTGGTSITFGPGIFYFNGTSTTSGLSITGNGTYTATGSTFVFEGTSSYTMGGSTSTLNLSAPDQATSGCVQANKYPEASFVTSAPYDGTDGQGICGVLIYQARGDTSGDTLKGGSSSIVNGIIYTPSAAFSDTGGASISSSTGGTLGVIANSFSVGGGGTLNLSFGTGGSAYSLVQPVSTTTFTPLLVQ